MNIFDFTSTDANFNYYINVDGYTFLQALKDSATDENFMFKFAKQVVIVVNKTRYGKKIEHDEAVQEIAEAIRATKKELYTLMEYYKKTKNE